MNEKEFRSLLEESAVRNLKIYEPYSLTHSREQDEAYGRYDMARYIQGHFEDLMREYKLVPRET
jgi:hypothetical protein